MELVVLRRLTAEIDAELRGTRIGQIFAIPPYHLSIVVGARTAPRLWLSAEPDEPHVYLRPGGHATPERPPAFAMAMRKHSRGRRIEALRVLGQDRVLELVWAGDGARLLFELIPRRATALLVGADDRVVAVWNPRRGRPTVGQPYSAPDRHPRQPAERLTPADWRTIESAQTESGALRDVVRSVGGTTKLVAREAYGAWRSGAEPRLATAVAAAVRRAAQAPTEAVVYEPGGDAPTSVAALQLAPYPLAHAEGVAHRFDSLTAAAAYYYPKRAAQRLLELTRSEIESGIRARRQRMQRALDRIRDSAPAADRSSLLRQHADLLLAHPHATVRDGLAELPDDYHGGEPLQLRVDPALDLIANAQRMYRRAQRLERKLQHDRRRTTELEATLDALGRLRRRAARMTGLEARKPILAQAADLGVRVRDLRLREPEAGPTAAAAEPQPPPHPAAPRVPAGIRRLQSAAGDIILVGRNAAGNDHLTHRVAHRDDWWLHAAGPGSHVVLRNRGNETAPPDDALHEAAAIAAWFSKARHATKVEVHWTQVRNVRRARKAAPGQALLNRYSTLRVEPSAPAPAGGANGDDS